MNRNFILLWQGDAISQIGSQVSMIAMLFWIKHATESPALMGGMAMTSGLAGVLLSPIGGVFADRYSRRSILVFCDLISGFAVLSLSLWMLLRPTVQGWTLAWVFAVSIVLSIVRSFFTPAIAASTADLVPEEKVAGANSMLEASSQISILLGQGIGGMLFRMLGAPLIFLIDGVTYLFSAFSKYYIRIPQPLTEKNGNWRARAHDFKRDILEGLGYIRTNTGLSQLLLIASFLNFFMAPILGLLPFYVEDHLKLHPGWYGYLLASFGVGNLVGYLLTGTVTVSGKARSGLIIAFIALISALNGLLGVVNTPVAVVVVMISIGTASGYINVNLMTILQITTPTKIRGRVFGLLEMLSACLFPIGMGLAGAAAFLVGNNIPVIYLLCGACSALVALAALFLSPIRQYLAFEPNKPQEVASPDQVTEEIVSAD
jgi:MFS transporter, DHA3 family, macrolide efflux protein